MALAFVYSGIHKIRLLNGSQYRSLIYLLLQNLFQFRDNGVAHFLSARVATEVLGHNAAVDGILDGLLNGIRLLGETERVPEHHGNRQDGADRVDDALS